MVTVIIPCYNASLYINKCIKSLLSQSFKDFKVVFIDDCSIDDTYHKLCQLRNTIDLNVTVLQNPENRGPAVSRNYGISMADTKYITFCDCDDWYENDFLETLVASLETNAADIAFCGYKVVDEDGKYILRPVSNKSGEISREDAFSLDTDSLCMLMVKTDIIKQIPLPNLRNGEDIATVPLLIAKAKRYAITDKCLYNYFRRHDSASEMPTIKVVESLLASFLHTTKYFPKDCYYELEFTGIKNVLYSTIITLFSLGYDKRMADTILQSFENTFPHWRKNPYIKNLRIYKKVIVKFLSLKLYSAVRIIAILRNIMMK